MLFQRLRRIANVIAFDEPWDVEDDEDDLLCRPPNPATAASLIG